MSVRLVNTSAIRSEPDDDKLLPDQYRKTALYRKNRKTLVTVTVLAIMMGCGFFTVLGLYLNEIHKSPNPPIDSGRLVSLL